MPERSGFFNAIKSGDVYDRVYNAEDFAAYFSRFLGDGVFIEPADQLQVVQKSGMVVTVKAGSAFIEGYWYILDENMDIAISPNTSAYETKTVICCTLNKSTRKITIEKRESAESVYPVNNGTVHELVLAHITVGVGVASITDSDITDTRPYKQYCGYVSYPVRDVDVDNLFTQFTDMFNDWFDSIKGKLGEDPATGLQQQIDNLPVIRSGAEEPSDSLGKDGDVYIMVLDD